MADDLRSVTVNRLDTGIYEARNPRGATLRFGSKAGDDFTPVELLLAALAGCAAVDVDVVTSRRAEPESFTVEVTAKSTHGTSGNALEDVTAAFTLRFPDSGGAEVSRALAARALTISHERTCTVSRTIETAVPVTMTLDAG